MIAEDQTFEDMTIVLDGGSFYRCTFIRCRMSFSGLLPCIVESPNFVECHFDLQGPAANTLAWLGALYRAGGQALVEETFDQIRGGEGGTGLVQRH